MIVLLAILAVLGSLALSVVQKARLVAARAGCENNLRDIVGATHRYHDAHGKLPPGYRITYLNDRSEATWVYFLLPHIGREDLFGTVDYAVISRWNEGVGFGTSSNTTDMIRTTPLPLFRCPADPGATNLVALGYINFPGYARGNYVANGGIGPMISDTTFNVTTGQDHALPGVFFQNSTLRLSDVTDGAANTAFVSELLVVPGEDWRGMMHYPEGPIYQHNHTPNSPVRDQLRVGTCVSEPRTPCIAAFQGPFDRRVLQTVRSRHAGGALVGMGDASVRFASDGIDPAVWRAAATPKAPPGEVAPSSDF